MNIREWLKNKHYINCIGNGWYTLIVTLCQDIIKLDDTVSISQVKEKFGGLRFYINGGTDEIYNLIETAEQESLKICEDCGTKKTVTTDYTRGSFWILTLCKKCRKKYIIKIKEEKNGS